MATEKKQKMRIDFKAEDWLQSDLEAYKNQHPEIDMDTTLLHSFILSLKEQVSGLEAQVKYLSDMVGNLLREHCLLFTMIYRAMNGLSRLKSLA